MRKLVVIATVWTVVVFVVGRMSVQVPANAEGRGEQGAGAGTPSGNGDVNGDGSLNIADPIYLLQHLFQGGQAPVPIAPNAAGLPATGQTKCYDDVGKEIPCDSARCPGQDGLYQAGCPGEGRFVDNGDGTVTDNCTGLMWQQNTADVNEDGKIDDGDGLRWCEALTYCENLSFAGHDDWRLPNLKELQSIVDYGRQVPAIDPVFRAISPVFEGRSHWYLSSTTRAGNLDQVWYVEFLNGSVFTIPDNVGKILTCHFRAVRNRP